MTTFLREEFETESLDFDINKYQVSSLEKYKKIFLTKKRIQNKENPNIPKELPHQKNRNIFENMKDRVDYINKYLIFQEDSFSMESDKDYGIDEFHFVEKLSVDENLFKVYYPGNYLFHKSKEDLLEDYLRGNDFSVIKRSSERLPNFKQKHYIRVNIKRTFMNTYLFKALNKVLKISGFITPFTKFPQGLAINVSKDFNKILMNMRLKEIFKAKELYEDTDNANYIHNLKIVDEIEKKGNPELNMILNRKLCCLFKEYINSEEFGKIELNRLKKEKDEYYIKKYVYLAKEFIEFIFSTEK